MTGRRIGQLAGAACLLVLTIGPSGAIAQGDKASAADKKFVKEVMQGGMAEVELGQLATQKAQSADVKQFGQKMVDDHTKLNDQMKPVASQLGITPPASLDMKHKAISTKLNKLSGDEFDKAYIKAMIKDHQKDVAEFQKEASTGSSAQVKDAASQGEPVISEHLKMIRQIAQAHNVDAGEGTTASNPAGAGNPR
jgi:putative membrane protein